MLDLLLAVALAIAANTERGHQVPARPYTAEGQPIPRRVIGFEPLPPGFVGPPKPIYGAPIIAVAPSTPLS